MDAALLRAFLDDCKADPADDAPRLILADWLEEHGDTEADRARGELIRVGCALARSSDRDDALEAARRRLNDAHGAAWKAELGLPGVGVSHTRGLVEVWAAPEDVYVPEVLHGEDNPAWAWIEELRVTGPSDGIERVSQEPFGALLASRLLTHPTRLGFRDVAIFPAAGEALGRWPGLARLHGLSLHQCGASDADVAGLLDTGRLGNLRRLQLSRSGLTADSLERVLRDRSLASLRDLDLGWNEIRPGPLPLLRDAVFRERLVGLSVWSNPLGRDGCEALAMVDLPALTRLDVGFCEIDGRALDRLVAAAWIGQLEELHLANNPLEDGILSLLRAPVDRLRALRLNFGSLEPLYIGEVVHCPRLARLRELSLYSTSLTADSVDRMIRAWRLPAVRDLDLSLNSLGDDGAAALAAWPVLRQLRRLDLGHTALTDVGLRAVLTSPHLAPATELVLYGNAASAELKAEAERMNRPIDP